MSLTPRLSSTRAASPPLGLRSGSVPALSSALGALILVACSGGSPRSTAPNGTGRSGDSVSGASRGVGGGGGRGAAGGGGGGRRGGSWGRRGGGRAGPAAPGGGGWGAP